MDSYPVIADSRQGALDTFVSVKVLIDFFCLRILVYLMIYDSG